MIKKLFSAVLSVAICGLTTSDVFAQQAASTQQNQNSSSPTKQKKSGQKQAAKKKSQKRGAKAKPQAPAATKTIAYKTVGDVTLYLHVFEPTGHQSSDKRAAAVFFFGGGWVGGSPSQFFPHCAHLAKQGMWAASAEYRIKSKHKTTPYDCVADGKSAVRYLRNHAAELGIDPGRIAAGGGSAGGHVAAATATVPALDEKGEDTSTSCVPNALLLFNAVYDNGPNGWGHAKVKDRYQEISPFHNIRKGMPPAIVFLGTNDKLIPVATGKAFQKKMQDVGSDSELHLYKDEGHGFFNANRGDGKIYRDTLTKMDQFLQALKFIK